MLLTTVFVKVYTLRNERSENHATCFGERRPKQKNTFLIRRVEVNAQLLRHFFPAQCSHVRTVFLLCAAGQNILTPCGEQLNRSLQSLTSPSAENSSSLGHLLVNIRGRQQLLVLRRSHTKLLHWQQAVQAGLEVHLPKTCSPRLRCVASL